MSIENVVERPLKTWAYAAQDVVVPEIRIIVAEVAAIVRLQQAAQLEHVGTVGGCDGKAAAVGLDDRLLGLLLGRFIGRNLTLAVQDAYFLIQLLYQRA